jgi:anti-sigma factor RsiW
MKCDQAETVLHCYFDNDFDALGTARFESHLEQCSECADGLDALKSLRSAMALAQLSEGAPVSLRKKVLASPGSPSPVSGVPGRTFWRWLAIAATFLLFAGVRWCSFSVHRFDNYETVLATEVDDAHLRSLQPGHLKDVIFSDQHGVKPWLGDKLDFSRPIRDSSDRGFPLQGAALTSFAAAPSPLSFTGVANMS